MNIIFPPTIRGKFLGFGGGTLGGETPFKPLGNNFHLVSFSVLPNRLLCFDIKRLFDEKNVFS